jgi:cyclic pyranopterin monophosphate synthase
MSSVLKIRSFGFRNCFGFRYSDFGFKGKSWICLTKILQKEERMPKLTHFDKKGRARMVDVSKKAETLREAVVRGSIFMNAKTFKRIMSGEIEKGDVFAVARVAGIMAAKRTSEIIPMCHPLNLSHVEVNFYPEEKENRIDIEAKVRIKAQTGVEMEGFVAVATAGLTIYDMCKAIDRGMVISNIHLVKKTGGKSGTYELRRAHRA